MTDFIPANEYRRHLKRAREAGNYFQFSRDYLKIMSRDEALMIQDLINQGAMRSEEDEWFVCTVGHLGNSLRWERNTQTRILGLLTKKGFIETKKGGTPPRRFIRIHFYRIEKRLDAVASRDLDVQSTRFRVDQSTVDRVDLYKRETERIKEEPDRAEPRSGATGGSPVFFDNGPSGKKKVEQVYVQFAEELRTILEKAKYCDPRWNKTKWARDLKRLHTQNKIQVAQIQNMIDWYSDHVGEAKLPKVKNAAHFRKVCDWIKERMVKSAKTEITISDDARKMAERLTHKGWPKGSKVQLPVAIQITMSAYDDLKARLKKLTDENPKHLPVPGKKGLMQPNTTDVTLAHYLKEYLPSTYSFVDSWMDDVHRRVANWSDWNGDLVRMAWDGSPMSPVFLKRIYDLCSYIGINSVVWDSKLKDRLYEG